MAKRIPMTLLAAAASLAAILPLRGDPRNAPVTHPEWARMLLRALDVPDAVRATPRASHAFAALSWKTSLAFRGDDYATADHVEVADAGRVVATTPSGTVNYPLSIVRPGDYRLRILAAGDPAAVVTAEIRPFGKSEAEATFEVTPAAAFRWIEAGTTHLDPGAYTASLLLPPGTRVEHVEVEPPCVNAVEPRGGWRATAIVETADLAVTALQAVDGESELPPAASPIEIAADRFQSEEPRTQAIAAGQTYETLLAGRDGLRAWTMFDVPEPGLYTLSVFGMKGAGVRFLTDHCLKAILCPSPQERGPEWWVVNTTLLAGGRHALAVNLGAGSAIGRIRLERKKDTDADYVATLGRLGFDVGPEGRVSRPKAIAAMEWIGGRRRQSARVSCGDVVPASDLQTQVASQAPGASGGASPGGTPFSVVGVDPPGTNPGNNPSDPLPSPPPPQDPGSPVTFAAGGGR
jgi:hypothetical protein